MNLDQMIQQTVQNSSATAALAGAGTGGGLFSGITAGSLFLMLIFSLIGTAYFIYGKKQQDFTTMLFGAMLVGFTYFVSDTLYMAITGITIIAVHYFLKRR